MTELADRIAAAAARADAPPATSWKPRDRASQHPPAIAGVVVEKGSKVGAGFNGETIATVTLRAQDGVEWLVWCFGAVLQQDLAPCQVGDVVAVKYEGHREGRGGSNGYELYRVVVDRLEAAALEASPAPATCEACGLVEPEHVDGCPNDDIPF